MGITMDLKNNTFYHSTFTLVPSPVSIIIKILECLCAVLQWLSDSHNFPFIHFLQMILCSHYTKDSTWGSSKSTVTRQLAGQLRNWGFIPGSSTNLSHDVALSDFQMPLHFTTLYVSTFVYTSSSLLLLVYSLLLVCWVFIITMNTQHTSSCYKPMLAQKMKNIQALKCVCCNEML